MKVTFEGGPLDGRTEEIPDEKVEEDMPVYWPSRDELEDEELGTPGVEGAAEYLYRGDGRAEYVGGQVS
jgi:hypothetical protein